MKDAGVKRGIAGALTRLIVFSALWWVMTEGASSMVQYGAVFVPLATALSLVLLPPKRGISVRGLGSAVLLFGWFLWQSFRGAVDVGVRSIRPRVDIDPTMITYETALPAGLSRVALMGISSLMPGTLSVKIDDSVLHIHVLDGAQDVSRQFSELERRIATVIGWKFQSR